MSSRFVRSSKFRHVFGTPAKKECCYDNLKVSRNAVDGNLIKVNPRFLSVSWAASGGGAFAVIPLEQVGKLPSDLPLFLGHTAPVLDTDFSPFNDSLIASCGEDTKIMIWAIPDSKVASCVKEPAAVLSGHGRKVHNVLFNPVAENVLASASTDLCVKIWDIEKCVDKITLPEHPDIINSLCWNYNGSLIGTACRDKKIRIFDVRAGCIVKEADGHAGVKGGQITWLGDSTRIVTTGFSKVSDRQVSIWDTQNFSAPLKTENLDTSSGSLMPFFDPDTKMLFLAGKGDGNIRFFEVVDEEPYLHHLSDHKSSEPQRGMAFMPKRALSVSENEIARAYKITTGTVEPISFKVPRKSDVFQPDLYPDTVGDKPALSADEYFGGKSANPILINLEKGFIQSEKKAFFAQQFPVTAVSPSPSPVAGASSSACAAGGLMQSNASSSSLKGSASPAPSSASSRCADDELRRMIENLRKESDDLKRAIAERDEQIKGLEQKCAVIPSLQEELEKMKKKVQSLESSQ